MNYKTIYLTGAPASGKSSTAHALAKSAGNVVLWEYGAKLTEFLQKKGGPLVSQTELREKSSSVVTASDINSLDIELVDFVNNNRTKSHIIIDSHPVTKESYGFRITSFSQEKLSQLSPDEIWVFYTDPAVTVQRIARSPAGRPIISEEQARMHSHLQASLAATYGALIGKPVYMFDTNIKQDILINSLRGRLEK